jgi:hypothetical protein
VGEGGGGPSFTDVWNAAKDVASIMVNGQTQHMPNRAFAVPSGQQPGALDWANEAEQTLQYGLTWGSTATDWGLSTGTSLRLGVTWKYGGHYQGQGLFLHDAQIWAVLDHSGLGQNFDVSASFGDAYLRGQTGVVSGSIRVEQKYIRLHWSDIEFSVEISGDGAGHIRRR